MILKLTTTKLFLVKLKIKQKEQTDELIKLK